MNSISDSQRQQINAAVAAAEAQTSAEIVPVVVAESGHYERAEDFVGLCCGAIFLLIADEVLRRVTSRQGQWQEPSFWPGILMVLMLGIGFAVGVSISRVWPKLRKAFLTRRMQAAEVEWRAKQMFFDQRVHHTTQQTGVLVYVSLFERQAYVLADEGVLKACGQSRLDQWCEDLTTRLKQEALADALLKSIALIGDSLAEKLPGEKGNPNELPDALITSPHIG